MTTVVFLGGGRITSAMLAGLRLKRARYRLVVHDRNPAKMRALKKIYAATPAPDLADAIHQADLLVVAVRPDAVRDLLAKLAVIRKSTRKKLLAVSLAAGVPLRVLTAASIPGMTWARAMPSPVCRSGNGLTALTFPRSCSRQNRRRVRGFFAAFGQTVEIPESRFDAFTVIYSSSHGYHALATLAHAAQSAGLDRKTALFASAHALADGIVAWRSGGHSLESLLEEAATPGGIAATTMRGMDDAGYRQAVQKGVAAGMRRARANAKD